MQYRRWRVPIFIGMQSVPPLKIKTDKKETEQ